jgi:predicted adenylyl cyclase CyaB
MASDASQTDFEIEIKTLLGDSAAADDFRLKLKNIDPAIERITSYTQLNHYFEGGDPTALAKHLAPKVDAETLAKMEKIASEGKKISVRTREMNGEAKIVMKASIGDDSSSNGVMRMEIESTVPGMTLEELDAEVLAAGYRYQAKWSRTREEYKVKDMSVCLDKNAGYGYLAEFEKVIQDGAKAEETKDGILSFMQSLGLEELPQERLERMFAYYNEHWPEYYGTENIFVIE